MLRVYTTHLPKEEAGKLLSQWLLEHKDVPVLLLLSGGSALSFLDFVEIPGGMSLALSVLDERFSADPVINNFLQLQATEFFARAQSVGAQTIASVPEEGESIEAFAKRFENALHSWRQKNPEGIVMATIGIGRDGHTAGILPFITQSEVFEELFIETERDVVGYTVEPSAETPYKERVTVTAPFLLREVSKAVVFATGPEKASVLERLAGDEPAHLYPMMILKRVRSAVLITDTAVAF